MDNKAEDTVHSGGGGLYGVEFRVYEWEWLNNSFDDDQQRLWQVEVRMWDGSKTDWSLLVH